MVNAIYEFMPDSRVRPFIGVGVGVAWAQPEGRRPAELRRRPASVRSQNLAIDDTSATSPTKASSASPSTCPSS